MNISELFFHGFGQFIDKKVVLKKGLNIIEAPNESGKTTLLKGIQALLFGSLKEGLILRKNDPSLLKYKPFLSSQFAGNISYSVGEESYFLSRVFGTDYSLSQLVDLQKHKDITDSFLMDSRKERNFLESQIGLNRSNFSRICCLTSNLFQNKYEGLAVEEKLRSILNEDIDITSFIDKIDLQIKREKKALSTFESDKLLSEIEIIKKFIQRQSRLRMQLEAEEARQSISPQNISFWHYIIGFSIVLIAFIFGFKAGLFLLLVAIIFFAYLHTSMKIKHIKAINIKKINEAEIAAELKGTSTLCEELAVKESQLIDLKGRNYRHQKKIDQLLLLKEYIAEVSRQQRENVTPLLLPIVRDIIWTLTAEKYRDVIISESFDIKVKSGEGLYIKLSDLSRGTIDQILVAFKIAALKLYSKYSGFNLPLLLDDALVNFDDERHARMITLISSLAKNHQILLCSCQQRDKGQLDLQQIPYNQVML